MEDPDRRPTAQEIEELIDLVRRDPASPAFVPLAEAYLALGRPRDAAGLGTLGLEHDPENLPGRVVLARAYAAMHQWREAQAELLRVVKVDRSNRVGFALLGEVLLRRNDFERAVPVLQHAQNLDPTSPQILTMLRRARAGQPLDAPPPIPQPLPPRGETGVGYPAPAAVRLPPVAPRPQAPSAAPPPMAPSPTAPPMPPAPHSPGPAGLVPTALPQMPTMAVRPVMEAPSRAEQASGFAGPPPPSLRSPKATAPPPLSMEGIRPRIVAVAKPTNAAAASLRQSAAVGESYLNDLLTGGLLDVAGVRVPDHEFDLRPDRRWGRSTRRAFAFLFIVLVFGVGGGGTYYWWSKKQAAAAVVASQERVDKLLKLGAPHEFTDALADLSKSLDKDSKNPVTLAYVAQFVGLDALLYGRDPQQGRMALQKLGSQIPPGAVGYRQVVIAKAALELHDLFATGQPAGAALDSVGTLLDEYLAKSEGDKWVRWLKGRVLLAKGDRKGARALFVTAGEGTDGVAPARVDQADLLVDDGKLDEALAVYKLVTDQDKDYQLAIAGRTLGRAEAGVDVEDTIGELNDKFNESTITPRVAAYRNLALAMANIAIEDYPKAKAALAKATAGAGSYPREPRFWSRVAWIHYTEGDLKATAEALAKTVTFGGKREDPTVQLVYAASALATGLPEQALTAATKIDGVRPRVLRTWALIELGKFADAQQEIEAVIAIASGNVEAKLLREQARALGTEKERTEATEELERLARRANSKLGRHILGVTLLALGDPAGAKTQLDQAMGEISVESPNPVAYRTLTALAQLALQAGDLPTAGAELDKALDLNPAYFPTLALQAQIVLRDKRPDRALQLLEPILGEPSAVTTSVKLTFAEVLVTRTGSTAQDKDRAKQLVTELVGKAPDAELARIAALISPTLPAELQLPDPNAPVGPNGAPIPPTKPAKPGKPAKPAKPKRHHR